MEKNTDRDNKPKGWFSRRHATRDAHETARAKYLADHGRQTRRENAVLDREDRAKRTPEGQLEELDHRLGKGVGAVKERARLQRQIDELAASPKTTKTTSKKER